MSRPPRLVVAGEPRHGVARYAALVASAVRGAEVVRVGDPADAEAALAGGGAAHLHVTDRLWGPTPEAAATRVEQVARTAPVSVTLHDLPQPSDGDRLDRRAAAYGRIAAAARAVAVCSRHEARAFATHVDPARAVTVIPHALDVPAAAPARPAPAPEVAVLGFLYPGKGHDRAIDAVAALPEPRPAVVALGAPSPGHEADRDALQERAERAGVRFRVTGHVPDADLPGRLRAAAVPLAAHAHLSASGSIATWVAAGRRPLVTDGPYARELGAERPGAVTLVADADLPAAVARALADPASTWWTDPGTLGPGLDATARAHERWWADVWR